jgi:hypothetical protein
MGLRIAFEILKCIRYGVKKVKILAVLLFSFSTCFAQSQATTQEVSQAKKILERLTGTKWPGDSQTVLQMADLLHAGQKNQAADLATQQAEFLNVTVKQMALKMSTIDESVSVPLNDFAASFIGVVRDNRDARELLSGNFYYRPMSADGNAVSVKMLLDNTPFSDLENSRANIAASLERVEGQLVIVNDANGTAPNPDPAGVLTSRTFLQNHAVAGTNRRAVEYTFREFMCISIENWADTNAPDARIGRDIDRFPGGSHLKFQTSCKGCHSVMDGFRGAFARWDFGSNAVNTTLMGTGKGSTSADGNQVVRKMNKNNTVYPGGFVMTDDSWVNYATIGNNSVLFGWRGPTIGNGVKGLGEIVSNSKRFSQCMSKRVFESVCQRAVDTSSEQVMLADLGKSFEATGYNLRKLFQEVAIRPECL